MRTYSRFLCPMCNKCMSNNGAARIAHCRKHVREGLMQEKLTDYGPQTNWIGRVVFDYTDAGRERIQDNNLIK